MGKVSEPGAMTQGRHCVVDGSMSARGPITTTTTTTIKCTIISTSTEELISIIIKIIIN